MTRGSEWTRLWTGAGTFLAALVLLLVSPVQPEAASADCGQNSGDVCWENEACVGILFYNQCTTEYKYYRTGSSGGEGGATGGLSDDAGGLPGVFEGDGCQWGQDYVGWEPRAC